MRGGGIIQLIDQDLRERSEDRNLTLRTNQQVGRLVRPDPGSELVRAYWYGARITDEPVIAAITPIEEEIRKAISSLENIINELDMSIAEKDISSVVKERLERRQGIIEDALYAIKRMDDEYKK